MKEHSRFWIYESLIYFHKFRIKSKSYVLLVSLLFVALRDQSLFTSYIFNFSKQVPIMYECRYVHMHADTYKHAQTQIHT